MTASRLSRARSAVAAGVVALALPFGALAGSQVPFKGADAGVWGEGTHDCSGLFPVFVETSGRATHVGNYSYSARECVNFANATYSGTWELTAANGDKLTGAYAGSFAVAGSNIEYEQENGVEGGTGRFANADGSFHVSGLASLIDFSDRQVLEGSISSVGSSK